MTKLIIVESPAKGKKIAQLLGSGYIVKASMGHINQLSSTNMGIDIENGFEPSFEIAPTKMKTVKELKEMAKKCDEIILAGDADREGEAICYHVAKELGLNVITNKRIIFHEITKKALKEAVDNPTVINMNLVKAQQTRQILDKLMGFEISPLLWKKIQPKLSAGRVQSPLLNLVIERENEIENFNSSNYFRTTGLFSFEETEFNTVLDKKFEKKADIMEFLEDVQDANFTVLGKKKGTKTKKPSAPFTTSSLLQEASSKLHLSSKNVMDAAQKLYEAGKITYHRTDSVCLSDEMMNSLEGFIQGKYGDDYFKKTVYQNKVANSQEAHEAIRPTHLEEEVIEDSNMGLFEKKLYGMIWKRTVASQMAPAKYDTLEVKIQNDERDEIFIGNSENLIFPGFLKAYTFKEETENEETQEMSPYEILDKLKKNDDVERIIIESVEKYTQGQGRFTEASLIKKMQDTGIGRPSTYSSMIQKIQDRGYVVKDTRDAGKGSITILTLEKEILEKSREITLKKEINKLFPSDIGKLTNKFMNEEFLDLIKPEYTAMMEERLDMIAEQGINWKDIIQEFYDGFHPKVVSLMGTIEEVKNPNSRLLGVDPQGKQIIARVGPYGPMVQCGTKAEGEVKYASLEKGQTLESITIGEAIELLRYPKSFGKYNGHDLMLKKGKYGPYLEYNKSTFSLKNAKINDPDEVDRERAIEIVSTQYGYQPKKVKAKK